MDKCELVSFRLGRWMRHVDFICHESPLPKSLRLDKLDIVRAILFAGFVFFNAPFFIVSFSLPVCVFFFFISFVGFFAIARVYFTWNVSLATLLPIL